MMNLDAIDVPNGERCLGLPPSQLLGVAVADVVGVDSVAEVQRVGPPPMMQTAPLVSVFGWGEVITTSAVSLIPPSTYT